MGTSALGWDLFLSAHKRYYEARKLQRYKLLEFGVLGFNLAIGKQVSHYNTILNIDPKTYKVALSDKDS